MDQRLVNLTSQFDTRQGEILGLHSNLGKGVDEQGARLRGLESRLKGEHDETQGELRAIRGVLEKIATSVDNYGEQIERLRLDHIGDMSVVNNQLEDIYWHVYKAGRSDRTSQSNVKHGHAPAAAGQNARPSKKHLKPRKSSPQTQARTQGATQGATQGQHRGKHRGQHRGQTQGATQASTQGRRTVSSEALRRRSGQDDQDIFTYREPVDKKLVIDAETTQHVARRFAKQSADDGNREAAASPRSSAEHSSGDTASSDRDYTYRGQKIRRTRSSEKGWGAGTTLRERLTNRGAKLKGQFKAARDQSVQNKPTPDQASWGGRFWTDVKSLFRDDDPRWTDRRK